MEGYVGFFLTFPQTGHKLRRTVTKSAPKDRARGERIKKFRHEVGLTQAQLALLTDVSKQTVYNWEAGAPPDQHMLELCVALGRTPAQINGSADAPPLGEAETRRLMARHVEQLRQLQARPRAASPGREPQREVPD